MTDGIRPDRGGKLNPVFPGDDLTDYPPGPDRTPLPPPNYKYAPWLKPGLSREERERLFTEFVPEKPSPI